MRATEFIVETAMMGKIADSGKIIRILKKAHTVPFSDEKNWLLVDMDPAKGNKGLGIKWIPADTRFEWVRPYRDTVDENLNVDVPNEEWLQNAIDYAIQNSPDRNGLPYMGKTTATVRNVEIPIRILKRIPGMRREQSNVRHRDLAAIRKIMHTTGKLPLHSHTQEEYKPFINVAYDGSAWVNEGNHRIMAAYELGWPSLPVEISYFDGGERVESGAMYPGKIGLGGVNENMSHSKDNRAVDELKAALTARKDRLKLASDDQVYDTIDKIMTRIAKTHSISGQKLHDMWVDRYKQVPDTWIMKENFADGKNPGRKGLAKRSGVNTKASVSSLRKTAKNSSGEKQRMAHWLANMKAGRKK